MTATVRVWDKYSQRFDHQLGGREEVNDGWVRVQNYRRNRLNVKHVHNNGVRGRTNDRADTNKVNPNFQAVDRMATSIYITNIPWEATAREVWNECQKWGTIIDVFIPAKLSKMGVRFGFVRFNRVSNVHALISNLRTIWMGSFHLFAEMVRKPRKAAGGFGINTKVQQKGDANLNKTKSFAEALKYGSRKKIDEDIPVESNEQKKGDEQTTWRFKKVIKLNEEDCLDLNAEHTQSSILAKVANIQVISSMHTILKQSGFTECDIRYIGGRWIWIELDKFDSIQSLKASVEMNKVITEFRYVDKGFVPDERVIWIDIVGVPLAAWTANAFKKIGNVWGESIYADIATEDSLAHGKVCVITRSTSKIKDEISVEVYGQKHVVKVKEFAYWVPDMEEDGENSQSYDLDTESIDESIVGETLNFQKQKDDMLNTEGDDLEEPGEFKSGEDEKHKDANIMHEEDVENKKCNSDPFDVMGIIEKIGKKSNDVDKPIVVEMVNEKMGNCSVQSRDQDVGENVVNSNATSSTSMPPGFKEFALKAKKNKEGQQRIGKNLSKEGFGSVGSRHSRISSSDLERIVELGNIIGLEMPGELNEINRLVNKKRVVHVFQ